MAQVTVTIDGKDHRETGERDNLTMCGLEVPYGSPWGYVERDGLTKPCSKCFPEEAKALKEAKAAA